MTVLWNWLYTVVNPLAACTGSGFTTINIRTVCLLFTPNFWEIFYLACLSLLFVQGMVTSCPFCSWRTVTTVGSVMLILSDSRKWKKLALHGIVWRIVAWSDCWKKWEIIETLMLFQEWYILSLITLLKYHSDEVALGEVIIL